MHAPVSKKNKRIADPLFGLCPVTKSSIVMNAGADVRSLTKAWHSRSKSPTLTARSVCKGGALRRTIRGGFLATWARTVALKPQR